MRKTLTGSSIQVSPRNARAVISLLKSRVDSNDFRGKQLLDCNEDITNRLVEDFPDWNLPTILA